MNEIERFKDEVKDNIKSLSLNKALQEQTQKWMIESNKNNYVYNFTWMGRPIIQFPQDMLAMQEIIWDVKPDLIIETGIAHGGSLIMNASFMEMMGIENGHILGIDIDIRVHNKIEIEKHPMFKRITMFEGSSISDKIIAKVKEFAQSYKRILVALDSNHTHEHVLKELQFYSPLVSRGSYCIVYDTAIEDFPEISFNDRPWGVGNNPKTAVREFIKTNKHFEIDKSIQDKLVITVAPDGYLKRVR